MLHNTKILFIITGSIAAYKALDVIRELRRQGATVRCILTQGGAEFITELSVSALSGEKVYTELFSVTDEAEMGHIKLAREHDIVLVAPASADFIAKMASGRADDLATAVLLATDKPILIAPAMNPQMWQNPATLDNIETLERRGVAVIPPASGEMACGEVGAGRFPDIVDIISFIEDELKVAQPLRGFTALVTVGATREPLDPVRFISNHSSGKQGIAIATALAKAGAVVTLVHGHVDVPLPDGVITLHAPTAQAMLEACINALPVDIAICTAAVADWQIRDIPLEKLKKTSDTLTLELTQTPDILKALCTDEQRPRLVIGFAAETSNALENASAKKQRKGCDWLILNEISPENPVFGDDCNAVTVLLEQEVQTWGMLPKQTIAQKLLALIEKEIL
jgi:phosphopantothenoylcysteine decarboxylase/phosphopantothenate--cysteine ligase